MKKQHTTFICMFIYSRFRGVNFPIFGHSHRGNEIILWPDVVLYTTTHKVPQFISHNFRVMSSIHTFHNVIPDIVVYVYRVV